jgi:hypothetical protein
VLLPALLLRSLIPFGFMPIAAHGGLSIGLCPGESAMPAAVAASHSQHVHHHSGTHPPPCLFAASTAPTFAPAVLALPVPLGDAAPCAAPDDACTVNLPSIRRAQSPRAPPQFS